MSNNLRIGAAALVGAPLLALLSNAVVPTLSDDGAARVAALTDHHGRMVAGMTLEAISIALMVGGIVWLAAALRPHAPRLAATGGIMAGAGALVVLFEDGLSAASAPIAHALGIAQAAGVVDSVHASAAGKLEPLALLFDLGLVVLGVALVKAGAPRWLGAALGASAVLEGVGMATEARPLVLAAFAALLVSLGATTGVLTGDARWEPARRAVAVS